MTKTDVKEFWESKAKFKTVYEFILFHDHDGSNDRTWNLRCVKLSRYFSVLNDNEI